MSTFLKKQVTWDQGGGGLSYDDDSEEVTGGEGGYLEKVTEGDMGEGGFSGPPKKGDVIYERPLYIIHIYLPNFISAFSPK